MLAFTIHNFPFINASIKYTSEIQEGGPPALAAI